MSETEPQIIHILIAGRALCGMPGDPVDWPSGHIWVDQMIWIGLAHPQLALRCHGCTEAAADE